MDDIFLKADSYQEDDLRILKLKTLGPNTYLANISSSKNNFATIKRKVIKFCGETNNAFYEADLINWSRIVSNVNIPKVEVLSIFGQKVWLKIEYINGESAETTLLKYKNLHLVNNLYERMINILASFQAKTYRNLTLGLEPKPPVSIISKWESRPRATINDYEMRLVKSGEESGDEFLLRFLKKLINSRSLCPVITLMAKYPLRMISKDANPRNWIVGKKNITLIDFSESAIDMGLRDLANLLTYNLSLISNSTRQIDRILNQYLKLYFSRFKYHYGEPIILPTASAYFWAATIYSTIRRFPSFVSHDKARVYHWLDELPILCELFQRSLYNKDAPNLPSDLGLFNVVEFNNICQNYRDSL